MIRHAHLLGSLLVAALAVLLLVVGRHARSMEHLLPTPPAVCDNRNAVGWYLPPPANAMDDHDEHDPVRNPGLGPDPYGRPYRALRAARNLMAAGEPSFRCGQTQTPAYRFVLTPSFRSALVVRAYRDAVGQHWILGNSFRTLWEGGPWSPEPAAIAAAVRDDNWQYPPPRRLSAEHWLQLEAAFATLPAEPSTMILDGENWMLEDTTGARHRWIDVSGPSSPEVLATGDLMVALAGCSYASSGEQGGQ